MERSAISHRLRLLRAFGLVARHRDGRRIVYRLHDDHLARLLDQAVRHIEHLRPGDAAGVSPRLPQPKFR